MDSVAEPAPAWKGGWCAKIRKGNVKRIDRVMDSAYTDSKCNKTHLGFDNLRACVLNACSQLL
jgi:hypothetical protein